MLEAWLRGRGSGKALIALEAGALVKAGIAPETRHSGETESTPEAREVGRSSYSFLLLFIPLIWVSYFMVPNTLPRDVVALPLPFPSSAKATPPSPSLSLSLPLSCSALQCGRHDTPSAAAWQARPPPSPRPDLAASMASASWRHEGHSWRHDDVEVVSHLPLFLFSLFPLLPRASNTDTPPLFYPWRRSDRLEPFGGKSSGEAPCGGGSGH